MMNTTIRGQRQPEVRRGLVRRPTTKRKAGQETTSATGHDGPRPDVERGGRDGKKKKITGKIKFRIATWNVGSMKGRAGEVVPELRRRRVDVCCTQETRWKGGSTRMLGNIGQRYKFLWQGNKDGTGGVGILVAEEWTHSIQSVKRIISDRIMLILEG